MAYASGDPGRPMTLIAGVSALMPATMAPGRAGFKWLGSCSDPARALCSHQRGETVAVLIQRNLGMLVLAIWLILYGLSGMVALGLPAPLMGILALIAGALILAGR